MDVITVYADFTRPECFLASRRADALRAAGRAVDWRAVELHPELPVTGRRLSATDQEKLRERLRALDSLLLPGEPFGYLVPNLLPKTEAAVSAFAEAYGTPVADDVRRLLMALYWTEGADIGNPGALRVPLAGPMLRSGRRAEPVSYAGFAVGADRAPVTTAGWRHVAAWRAEWAELGAAPLPVVLVDGAVLSGVDGVERLGKEVLAADAAEADGRDPRRYPHETVRPDPHWVSWQGGHWRNSARTPRG